MIARIAGAERPDEWVVRGNHHDAWVNGAEDPISGLVPLLEEARAFGLLLKQGWKPKRTIVYCAWDGEEPSSSARPSGPRRTPKSCGRRPSPTSTPTATAGGFSAWPVPTRSSASSTTSRGTCRTRRPRSPCGSGPRRRPSPTPPPPRIARGSGSGPTCAWAPSGSGSDYTAFIDHLGVASLNLGFGGEDDGGIYHSIYDDFSWYTRFSDTDFVYGRALAQTVGLAVLRLADAALLLSSSPPWPTRREYLKELKKLLERKQEEIAERNRRIEDGVFQATNDPRRPTVAPPREDVPPHLNFAPLDNAVAALQRSADGYARARARTEGRTLPPDVVVRLDALLVRSERVLLSPEGLPRRPWWKHLVYAPGVYAGYGASTLPGVREALQQKRYPEAESEIARVARVLLDEAALADAASAELAKVTP